MENLKSDDLAVTVATEPYMWIGISVHFYLNEFENESVNFSRLAY